MKKKNHQKPTRTQGMSRREQNDRLANWYMINLGWSLLAIFVLLGIRQGYRSSSTILYMQGAMWVFTAVFAVFVPCNRFAYRPLNTTESHTALSERRQPAPYRTSFFCLSAKSFYEPSARIISHAAACVCRRF